MRGVRNAFRSKRSWIRGHSIRARAIHKAFVKSGFRGYTIKGQRGFQSWNPKVW